MREKLRVVLSGMGSLGDVQPVLLVARELLNRGHEALICVTEDFEETVRQAGVPYRLYRLNVRECLEMLDPGRSGVFFRALRLRELAIGEQFRVLTDACRGSDLLVVRSLEFAAPSIAEYHDIPFVKSCIYPCQRSKSYPPDLFSKWNTPRQLNGALWSAYFFGLGLAAFGPVNRGRRALGLRRTPTFGRYLTSQNHTLYSVFEPFLPACPSWESGSYSYTGYGFADTGEVLPEELDAFLSAGPAPVYLGFGSMTYSDPKRLTEMIVEAIGRSGRRAVLSSGWARIGAKELPDWIHVTEDVPHDLLFPRVSAVVHHGGPGTLHAAARAGVPQLVIPFAVDQIHYGETVHRLGLGPKPLAIGEFDVESFSARLQQLLEPGAYAADVAKFTDACIEQNGGPVAADLIEDNIDHWRGRPTKRSKRLAPVGS